MASNGFRFIAWYRPDDTGNEWCWYSGEDVNGDAVIKYTKPTHWMQLPEPPNKEGATP